MGRSRKWSYW